MTSVESLYINMLYNIGGNSTTMNKLYTFTHEEDDNAISLALLCNRPPPEKKEEQWAVSVCF